MAVFLDILKDWGAHFISIAGIAGGIFAYFKHDKKIKEQEIILYDLQIKKIEKEISEEQMADVKCYIRRTGKGKASIYFDNVGKADALNVRIEVLTPDSEMNSITRLSKWGPYDKIDSCSFKEEGLIFGYKYPDEIQIKIIWDDTYQIGRSIERSVSIPKR